MGDMRNAYTILARKREGKRYNFGGKERGDEKLIQRLSSRV
jgi:hypothetical protein